MSAKNAGVPLYHPYIPGTAVHSEESGTPLGTEAGTPSLKSLSTLYLMKQKAVHPVVQPPVHQQKKCTTGKGGSGTLFGDENSPAQVAEEAQKIDCQICWLIVPPPAGSSIREAAEEMGIHKSKAQRLQRRLDASLPRISQGTTFSLSGGAQ